VTVRLLHTDAKCQLTSTFTDAPEPGDDSIDIDIVLSTLNSCCNDPGFNASEFFAIHNAGFDDAPLNREDVMSHLLNGQCANKTTPGCG
jgi:hypothetical protein